MAEHAQAWDAMDDEDRLRAISERADRSYHKIGLEFGVSEHVLSRFVRSQGATYHHLKTEHRKRRHNEMADRIAPLWKTGLSSPEIGEKLGIKGSSVDQITVAMRKIGDDRFPRRTTSNKKTQNTRPKELRDKSLRPVGVAFLRERHPDGKKYTPACIFKAHREFPDGFEFRKPYLGISQRELTNLTQLVRVCS